MSNPSQSWSAYNEAITVGQTALKLAAQANTQEKREFYVRLVEAAARLAQAAK